MADAAGGETDAIGSSMVLRLHAFSLHNRAGGSYGALTTTVQLKGFNVDVRPAPVRGSQGEVLPSRLAPCFLAACFVKVRQRLSHCDTMYQTICWCVCIASTSDCHPQTVNQKVVVLPGADIHLSAVVDSGTRNEPIAAVCSSAQLDLSLICA